MKVKSGRRRRRGFHFQLSFLIPGCQFPCMHGYQDSDTNSDIQADSLLANAHTANQSWEEDFLANSRSVNDHDNPMSAGHGNQDQSTQTDTDDLLAATASKDAEGQREVDTGTRRSVISSNTLPVNPPEDLFLTNYQNPQVTETRHHDMTNESSDFQSNPCVTHDEPPNEIEDIPSSGDLNQVLFSFDRQFRITTNTNNRWHWQQAVAVNTSLTLQSQASNPSSGSNASRGSSRLNTQQNWYIYDPRLVPETRTHRHIEETRYRGVTNVMSMPGIIGPPPYEEVQNHATPLDNSLPFDPPPPYTERAEAIPSHLPLYDGTFYPNGGFEPEFHIDLGSDLQDESSDYQENTNESSNTQVDRGSFLSTNNSLSRNLSATFPSLQSNSVCLSAQSSIRSQMSCFQNPLATAQQNPASSLSMRRNTQRIYDLALHNVTLDFQRPNLGRFPVRHMSFPSPTNTLLSHSSVLSEYFDSLPWQIEDLPLDDDPLVNNDNTHMQEPSLQNELEAQNEIQNMETPPIGANPNDNEPIWHQQIDNGTLSSLSSDLMDPGTPSQETNETFISRSTNHPAAPSSGSNPLPASGFNLSSRPVVRWTGGIGLDRWTSAHSWMI